MTFNTLTPGTTVLFTAHAGSELITFKDGFDLTGTTAPTASGSITATTTGYNITLPGAAGSTTYAVPKAATFSATSSNPTANLAGRFAASTLTYATYGTWATTSVSGTVQSIGVFAGGVPGGGGAGDRPSEGNASYSGKTTGFASTGAAGRYAVNGNVNLTANFSANTIAGSVTGVTAQKMANDGTLGGVALANDISLSAGKITGITFVGTARAVDSANAQFAMGGSTGTFGGSFYGVGAAEAAGSIAMTLPGMNVITSFGVAK